MAAALREIPMPHKMVVIMVDPILEVREIRHCYGSTVALDGVSLTVGRGELFGLLGPNGAGKTTLMSILAGLQEPSDGSVWVAGQRLSRSARGLRCRIGIATQDLALYPELTARENLLFFGRLYRLHESELRPRVETLLATVGLSDRAEQRAGTFSGGMKRRLNLAIAVVHQPELLLLDEPTTGVDPQSRNHIFEFVRQLNSAGLTVIYTSHYMEEVQSLCPRIAILDQGRLLACDTLPNLLRLQKTLIHLRLPQVPAGLIEKLQVLPGVTEVQAGVDQITLTTTESGLLLPKLAAACLQYHLEPTSLELDQPTLERVFLHLTGHELRD